MKTIRKQCGICTSNCKGEYFKIKKRLITPRKKGFIIKLKERFETVYVCKHCIAKICSGFQNGPRAI